MKHFLALIILTGILAACTADPSGDGTDPISDGDFESTVTNFGDKEFKNPVHIEILKELDVCEFKSADSTYYATCTPDNFKIIEFKNGADVKDAFILEMKAGIFPKDQEIPLPPVRHIIVFEREGNKLVRVGGFRGDLIELRKNTKTGAKDLVLALFDTDDQTLFHCLFKWNGKKYEFSEIERLDFDGKLRTLKEENKAEMTQQIFQQLQDKSLIF